MTTGEIIAIVSLAADSSIVIGFLLAFRNHLKKLGIKEGEHLEVHKRLREDIELNRERVNKIEDAQNDVKVDVARLDAKLDGINDWLRRIAEKIGVA